MKLLKPDAKCRYLTDVTPATVKALGCKAVLIDADNTSSYDLTTDPLPGTEDWVRSMKEAGLKVLLLSNAKAERAKVLADHFLRKAAKVGFSKRNCVSTNYNHYNKTKNGLMCRKI